MSTNRIKLQFMPTSNGRDVASFFQDNLDDFCNKENIQLEVNLVSWNQAYESIIRGFKNEEQPDILQLGTTWVTPMAHLGYIAPISGIEIGPAITDWLESYFDFQGERFAVPWGIESMVMLMRKKYLDELDIYPEKLASWEGFREQIKAISERRRVEKKCPLPLMFTIRPEMETVHRVSSFYFSAGYNYPDLTADFDKFLSDDNFISVVKYISSLLEAAELGSNEVETHPYKVNENFYFHDSSVFFIGNWFGLINGSVENGVRNEYKILPLPGKGRKSGTYLGGSALAISAKTKHPRKALRLLERITEQDFVVKWQNYADEIPAYDYGLWQKRHNNETIKSIYDISRNTKAYPVHPAWGNIEKIMSTDISRSLWQLFVDSDISFEDRVYGIFKESDRKIKNLLDMAWELN